MVLGKNERYCDRQACLWFLAEKHRLGFLDSSLQPSAAQVVSSNATDMTLFDIHHSATFVRASDAWEESFDGKTKFHTTNHQR